MYDDCFGTDGPRHILNKIFKMKYETHAYGIEFVIENVFKKWNEKKQKFILKTDFKMR